MLVSGFVPHALAQTAPGTAIRNVGSLNYVFGGLPTTTLSNESSVLVEPPPSRATIDVARFDATAGAPSNAGPTQCQGPSGFAPLPAPTLASGQALDPSQPIPIASTATLHGDDPLFIRIADADQNRDATVVDTVDVRVTARDTSDSELLRLVETAPNSGVFVGFLGTRTAVAVAGDCTLQVARDSSVDVSYVDPRDATDRVAANALVDPFGLVFDSQTGLPVDGARVRLVDAATGAPATVFGDDGVSRYPAELVTGQAVTDSGGTTYVLPPGVYRFPLVASGDYRLEITPPNGYVAPSTEPLADLQALPGAPFRLSDGSFGRAFTVTAPVAAAIDVPVDPSGTSLLLRKTASATIVAPGDFVQYTLVLENTSTSGDFRNVQTVDRLPAGLRLRRGSVRVDDRTALDPAIAGDGRTMTFTTALLAPGERTTIRYVAEVTVAAKERDLVNVALARALGGVASNEARALVRLRNDLFSERGFLVGRVYEGDCGETTSDTGVAGVRIYLEDGRYAVADEEGKFHFEDVAPGTHVVQLDSDTLPAHLEFAPCGDDVRHAGRAYSQFVDLRAGALWRADFALRMKTAPTGRVTFDFASALVDRSSGERDEAQHVAHVAAESIAAGNVRVLVMVPNGFEYVADSATVDGKPLPGVSMASGVLTLPLGEMLGGTKHEVRWATQVTEGAAGDLPFKALVSFDSPSASGQRTAPAESRFRRGTAEFAQASYTFTPRFDVLGTELAAADRRELERIAAQWRGVRDIKLHVVGHTDATPISKRRQQIFADNYALSRARADAVARFLIDELALYESQVVVDGRGADEPVSNGRDAASLAANRRVDIAITGSKLAKDAPLELVSAGAPAVDVATQGIILRAPKAVVPRAAAARTVPTESASFDIEKLTPGLRWLAPEDGFNPPIASLKLAIQHAPSQKVALTLNGEPVSTLDFDGLSANRAKTVAVSRWRGVDLRDGDNVFVAVVTDADGAEAGRITRTVHYGAGAVRGELSKPQSTLVADGKTRPAIALQMFDAYGKPARRGTLGVYRVDAPYRSWWEVESLDDNELITRGAREPTFEVGDDGIARLELEPTTRTGYVTVHLRYNERQTQDVRVWLEPAARDWILVGVAEGTGAYKTISQNADAALEAGEKDGFEQDGRVAFFAKGRIKGEFLLTVAYDSARDREDAKRRLNGVIEPDRYYTLYGDGTEQREEAASARKLYVKLERRQFVALFGDYDTGFTLTELTRYGRTMNGFRADFAGNRADITAFAARTDQGFVRDELRGDGTSGLYRLSRRPLIVGSEKITLEIRDRFRSEQVVESRQLTRFIDYSIDYDAGTLFFKEPVPSRDPDFNPVYLLVDYETNEGGTEQTTGGARATLRFAGDKGELGATYIQEGAQAGDSKLAGADLRYHFTAATQLRAEAAHSSSDDPTRASSANAWLAELEHITEKLDAKAYVRQQDGGFGVGQQLSSESATRKGGFDARWTFSEAWQLVGEAYRQEQMDTDANRNYVSAEVRHQAGSSTLGFGARSVTDEDGAGVKRGSDQAFASASIDVLDDRVTLRAASDMSLGSTGESIDYPSRSLVGVDYHFSAETTLFAEYEMGDGRDIDTDMTRVGVRARPWERTQITSSVNRQFSESGLRTFANLGLMQGWQASERWALDFGVDQSHTIAGLNAEPVNPNAPLASGDLTEDFFATFAGAQYRTDLWTWTSRAEHRDGDTSSRWSLTSGLYREPVEGHAMSLALQAFSTDVLTGADTREALVRFSWAYRPNDSRWIVFDRLDLRYEKTTDLLVVESWRLVDNLHANLQLDAKTQIGLQYGARWVASSFDGERFTGYSDLVGFDVRRDLSHRFDVGLHGAVLHSWQSDILEGSVGLDVGVTLARNVWVSIGYNFTGFDDRDFSESRWTSQGPFIKLRIKADQDTFRDLRLDSLRAPR